MNYLRMPLNEVPPEFLAVLNEYNANFEMRWSHLLSTRQDAMATGNQERVDEINFEICQMMAAINGDGRHRKIVARIVGGQNGYAIFSEEFLAIWPLRNN